MCPDGHTGEAIKGIMRNPMIRNEHPNPREEPFSIFDNAMGMTMPQMNDPDRTTPKAAARFLSKYCDTAANTENYRRPMT